MSFFYSHKLTKEYFLPNYEPKIIANELIFS
jgi:hypothetical protein